jgi:hypothetical protein
MGCLDCLGRFCLTVFDWGIAALSFILFIVFVAGFFLSVSKDPPSYSVDYAIPSTALSINVITLTGFAVITFRHQVSILCMKWVLLLMIVSLVFMGGTFSLAFHYLNRCTVAQSQSGLPWYSSCPAPAMQLSGSLGCSLFIVLQILNVHAKVITAEQLYRPISPANDPTAPLREVLATSGVSNTLTTSSKQESKNSSTTPPHNLYSYR